MMRRGLKGSGMRGGNRSYAKPGARYNHGSSPLAQSIQAIASDIELAIDEEIATGGPRRFVPKKRAPPPAMDWLISEHGRILTQRYLGVRIEEVADSADGRKFLGWMLWVDGGVKVPLKMQRKIRIVLAVKDKRDAR